MIEEKKENKMIEEIINKFTNRLVKNLVEHREENPDHEVAILIEWRSNGVEYKLMNRIDLDGAEDD